MDSKVVMVGISIAMNSKILVKMPEKDAWTERACKGSHPIFTHPSKPGHIRVPDPEQDMGGGITHKLRKQAGVK
jgi:predicted RNA binding protein YcfA (HicA-like mRNA interferase family)